MARKQSQNPKIDSPQTADNFELVKGIGPALASRLHQAGILTFKQLASLTSAELALKAGSLSAKQIARQNWIGQARKLSAIKPVSSPTNKAPVKRELHQHYQNFTVEFLLDELQAVRRTRVVHVQSGDADTWAGWEPKSFINFLVRHAGVRVPKVNKNNKVSIADRSLVPHLSGMESETGASEASAPPGTPAEAEPVPGPTAMKAVVPAVQSQEIIHQVDPFCLQNLEVIPHRSRSPVLFLQQDQPYIVRLHLALAEGMASRDHPLIIKASVRSKQLGGPSHAIGETVSRQNFSENVTLDIDGASLPPGAHRLEAFVELRLEESSRDFTTSIQGNLLHVY